MSDDEIARLSRLAVDAQLDAAARRMADLRGRRDFAEHRRLLDVLGDVPGTLLVLGRRLQIAPRHVETAGVAEDVLERLRHRYPEAARADRHHQLDFVVIVLRAGRVGHCRSGRQVVVGGLYEVERRLAIDRGAHFLGVIFVIAADAENAADRKMPAAAAHRRGRLRRRSKDVCVTTAASILSPNACAMSRTPSPVGGARGMPHRDRVRSLG